MTIRLALTGVLIAICSAYVTLVMTDPQLARDIGLVYAITVSSIALGLHRSNHRA